MISELARVFSSQGVLIQGTTYASRPSKLKSNSENGAALNPVDSFASHFDQASAKLELSKDAKEKINAGPRAGSAPNDPASQDPVMFAASAQVALQPRKEIAQKSRGAEVREVERTNEIVQIEEEIESSEKIQSTIKNGGEKVGPYSRSGASLSRAMGNAVSVYA